MEGIIAFIAVISSPFAIGWILYEIFDAPRDTAAMKSHDDWLGNMKKVSRTGTFEEIRAAARSKKFK